MTPAKPHVLLVEDSPEVRKLAKTYLVSLGLDVTEAGDGRGALERLKERVPDLVCLDIMLPEISGYELCELIRATPKIAAVPILMISARSAPTDHANALEAGANAFLVKPFRFAEFSRMVKSLLGQSETVSP
jgi:two-component system chemotaxis response regulator CheY